MWIGRSDDRDQVILWEGKRERSIRAFPQNDLISIVAAANPHTILIVNSGGNVDMNPWIDHIPAMIQAWYPGQAGGTALAEILFGDTNPSGKLPVSFEKRFEDNAAFGQVSYQEKPARRTITRDSSSAIATTSTTTANRGSASGRGGRTQRSNLRI